MEEYKPILKTKRQILLDAREDLLEVEQARKELVRKQVAEQNKSLIIGLLIFFVLLALILIFPWFTSVGLILLAVGAFFLTEFQGKLVYQQRTFFGREPWVFDPSTRDNSSLRDIVEGSGGSRPENFVVVNDLVFFTTLDPTPMVWISDGTTDGTRKLANGIGESFARMSDSI